MDIVLISRHHQKKKSLKEELQKNEEFQYFKEFIYFRKKICN